MDSIIPDTALVVIITYTCPMSLYYIYQEVPQTQEELGLLYSNVKQIKSLLDTEFVVSLLCEKHRLNKVATFTDFLDSWDFWNIDKIFDSAHDVITPAYFLLRWKNSIKHFRALEVCARNAERDSNWLPVIDHILNSECLWCDETSMIHLSRGFFRSRDILDKYMLTMKNYYIVHGKPLHWEGRPEIPFPIFDTINYEQSTRHDDPKYGDINSLDYHEIKESISCQPREQVIIRSIYNDDYRILMSVNYTAKEIEKCFSTEWISIDAKKARYFYDLGVTLDSEIYNNWVQLFRDKELNFNSLRKKTRTPLRSELCTIVYGIFQIRPSSLRKYKL